MPSPRFYAPGYDPGDPNALLVPVARVLHVAPAGTTRRDIDNLAHHLGGRAAKPTAPVMIRSADGTPALIAGAGVTEAAELQDLAYALQEKQQARIRAGRTLAQEHRDALGLRAASDLDTAFREAVAERVKHHQTHAVTDPARTPGWAGKRLY